MAQTVYTTVAVTAQTRRIAYQRLAELLTHMPNFPGVDVISIVRNGNNTITITLSNPIPPDQLEHLGLD